MEVLLLPAQDKRVETGPVQFGDDWPGVFVRGDNAGWYAFQLRNLIENKDYDFPLDMLIALRNMHSDMISAVVGPSAAVLALREKPEP